MSILNTRMWEPVYELAASQAGSGEVGLQLQNNRISKLLGKIIGLLLTAGLAGCSTSLVVNSYPEGAIVTDIRTGQSYGETPVTLNYNLDAKSPKDADGCFLVNGLKAQWRSGAVGQTAEVIRLCGKHATFNISIPRPQVAGLNIDQDYVMQRDMLRLQQQAVADQRRAQANANLLQYLNTMKPQAPPAPIQCMRDPMGNYTCY